MILDNMEDGLLSFDAHSISYCRTGDYEDIK